MAFTPFTKDDRPTMAAFNEKFAEAIGTAVEKATDAAVKISSGSYVGTNKYGSTNPVSLTLPFNVKLLYVVDSANAYSALILPAEQNENPVFYMIGGNGRLSAKITGNVVSWYSNSNAISQFNGSGYTYNWFALGINESEEEDNV